MVYTLVKLIVTAVLIVTISEVSKRNALLGAILTTLPLTSILVMVWLYIDTKDVSKITNLSINILWFIIPSTTFFVSVPLLLKKGLDFYLSLGISCVITGVSYFLMIMLLTRYGVKL